jgi:glycosyltransferase involved in cell wall biosynthesis
MRIGIECLRADPDYVGGLNTYILGLLDGFAAAAGGHCFQLYTTDRNHKLFARYEALPNFELVTFDGRWFRRRQKICRAALLGAPEFYRRISGRLFNSIREIMEAGSDLIYTPTVSLLCFNYRKPTLLSMHDIQHLHYPEFFNWPQRRSRKITYGLSARSAVCFQASSEFIKQDMLAHFAAISPEQIAVIREGVKLEDFSTPCDTGALEQYKLPERFLFLPAQLWPHKNHITFLQALRRIEQVQGVKIPLVMTGAKYSAAPAIFRFLAEGKMHHVRCLGKVPFEELVALYQRAALAISPSLYESNSLPVLEAAAAGTAVIASKIPPNEELARTLQLNLFEPLAIEELAELIFRLWQDEAICRVQAAHNRSQIARFSWENAARQYLSLMERIANPGPSAPALQSASALAQ